VSVLLVLLIVWTQPTKEPNYKPLAPARVEIYKVQSLDLYPTENLIGRLQPSRRTSLKFELSGQVQERLLEPGQKVEAGDVLLQLADGDFLDAKREAQAQYNIEQEGINRDRKLLKLAQHNRKLQEKEVKRLESLRQQSMVSRSRLDEARQLLTQLQSEEARLNYSVESAYARLHLRKVALDRAIRNLNRTRLTAPFPGVINAVHAQIGDYVSPAQTALELVDIETLELYLEVRGQIAALLNPGDAVQVRIEPGTIQGTIVAIQRDPNQSTFTYALRISLPGSAGLPGMLAQAQLSLPPLLQIVAVPASSVVYEEGSAYVMILKGDILQRIAVRLGDRVKNWQTIENGLQPGDQVVSRDVAALSHGQKVLVENKTASKK